MKHILIIIMIIGLFLMCSCGNNKLVVGEALETLLNSDNYKGEFSVETKQTNANEVIESKGKAIIFHNPYRSKSVDVYNHPDDQGVISCTEYELEEGGITKLKFIYTYEDGSTKETTTETVINGELLIRLIKDCLISEELVSEQVIDGTNVKKYKISVTAYPFGYFLRVPYGKNDYRTKIFMDEYKTCEGYVYINSETNYIQKIEFDLSDKMVMNKEIVEKVTTGTINDILFTMPDYSKFIITMQVFDINEKNKDTKDTEKEIDNIMK